MSSDPGSESYAYKNGQRSFTVLNISRSQFWICLLQYKADGIIIVKVGERTEFNRHFHSAFSAAGFDQLSDTEFEIYDELAGQHGLNCTPTTIEVIL